VAFNEKGSLFLYPEFYKITMKKLFSILCTAVLLSNCGGEKTETLQENVAVNKTPGQSFFGDTITGENAVQLSELEKKFEGKDSLPIKLTGKIMDVCQKKGCWMEMDLGNNKSIRVTFKDYAFFVPKDAAGKTAIIDGYAYTDTISVAMQKHYAEDEGKSKAEIEAIKEPQIETTFEARGVIIQK
jgi:hypothetical protein